ncbi:formyltransferase family protein [Mucilaginibacter sp. UYCu711]|uniref:formyltransferase family protein n=1 Tax=Mucilaginibacter sp. UYCu711 TaxID=3156339 RepID=UPI003D1A61D0
MGISVILLGSKPGSVVVLAKMLQLGWDVKYVIVPINYDSNWIAGPTLEEFAKSKGLKVLYGQKDLPDNCKVDFVISYMYRNLVQAKTINLATQAALNFHAGPLPEFGGWAFYNLAILEDVAEYGCTCHYMDNSFDTGPLLKVSKFPIEASQETAVSLERKTQKDMIKLFVEFCDIVVNEVQLPYEEQNKDKMRYLNVDEFKKLKQVPADADAQTIDKYARAFWYPPYECAYTMVNNVKVEIIPEIAKNEIASHLHQNDFKELLTSAGI